MVSPDDNPGTFLLGVGAQKSGTAWMHRYLESSAACDPGFRKEYHVWDGLDLAQGGPVRARVAAQARRAADALAAEQPADVDALRRASFYADPATYFDYFESLLRRNPAVRLTADITPAYAELSVERLAAIRDGFAARGVRCVAVYLMRDPVERIWSAVRMDSRRGSDAVPGRPEDYVAGAATRPMYADRTRYDRTIARLDEVFGDEVHYGFYERLFDLATLGELCGFLGIEAPEPVFDRQVNVSPKGETALSDEVAGQVAHQFPDVYAAVAARFPDLELAELWPSARLL